MYGARIVCGYCCDIEERRSVARATLERRVEFEMRLAEVCAEARRREEITLVEQGTCEEKSRVKQSG
jgi:hypothetical protein